MGMEKFRRKVVGGKADFSEQFSCIKGTLSATTVAMYGILNPLETDIIVSHIILDIATACSATPVTLDIGCAAATALTSNDNLIDGLAIGTPTVAAVYNSGNDKGTNGAASRKWLAAQYLTVTASATPTSVVGSIYIYYRKA